MKPYGQIDRRQFLQFAGMMAPLVTLPMAWGKKLVPEIAFTFDDPTTNGGANLAWQEVNERILQTLAGRKIKSVLFVCGKRVDSEAGRSLVTAWDRAGHLIGNHTYSHPYFDASTLAEFEADTLKCEPLIHDYHHFARLFCYPYFKEGNTAEKRDGMRSFLQEHGYRIGRATLDASDWAIDARLNKRLKKDPKSGLSPYRDFFLQHIWERTQFYESLAQRILARPLRHTLLLHHSALNALFLDDLMAMFLKKGWRPVDAEWAYKDPVYDRQPRTLPAGESLLWALAKETGKFENELRYPGEDDVYENPKMDELKL